MIKFWGLNVNNVAFTTMKVMRNIDPKKL